VLVNLRFALRGSPQPVPKVWITAVECVGLPVYVWLRCVAFPYRVYRCFSEVLPQLSDDLWPSTLGLYIGVAAISISYLLNLYWSALILRKVPPKMRPLLAQAQKYFCAHSP
jgi:hypothetical protein